MHSRRSFSTAEERLGMGRTAQAAGRAFDARAWYTLALRVDPSDTHASRALADLVALEQRPTADRPADPAPWESTATAPGAASTSRVARQF